MQKESLDNPFCDRERRAIHVPSSALAPFEECAAGSPRLVLLPPVVLDVGPIHRRGSCHPPARDGDAG
ncbi:MAG TPA: hypothetical protein PLT63_09290 [Syntrophales bacterium]|nr:hypothetical protein [Syntrophales bacterium]